MQQKLNDLLEECDEKIKNLEDLNIKWADFNGNLGNLKNWVNHARTKLNQILAIDVSPDDRVKMTKELQGDVKAKMKRLQSLERDAEALCCGDGSALAAGLIEEVSGVKRDVEALNMDVDQHSNNVAKDLENWHAYREDVDKVRPWLEKAETKIAMGLTRPSSLDEAKEELKALAAFAKEVDSMKGAIAEASQKGGKISCSNSAVEEVDALMSRWKAVKTASDQWKQKMLQLVDSWDGLQKLDDDLTKWMDEKEELVNTPVEVEKLDAPALNSRLQDLKELNNDITQKQRTFLNLAQACDVVAPNLTQESAGDIRANASGLRDRLHALSDGTRQRMNDLSDAMLVQQDINSKFDNFKMWLKDMSTRVNALNEVPSDKIDVSLETCHDLSQAHEDKRPELAKIQKEVEAKGSSYTPVINDLQRKYKDLGTLLNDKKQALKRWSSFWTWHADSIANLRHLQQTIESGPTSISELETVSSELDNLAVQCQTRKAEGSDDEHMAAKSKTYVMQNGKPMSILLLVADILQKIVGLKDLVRNKEQQVQQVDNKWEEFRQAEQRLADWLQAILQRVQKINVKENNIDALRAASEEVTKVNNECIDKSHLKENYQKIGKELMAQDPSQVKMIQDALSEATSKWEKVASLLQEQQAKSQSLLGMWEKCNEMKRDLLEQLNQVQDIYDMVNESDAVTDAEEVTKLVDSSRKGLDLLKKLRHPFEAYYKKMTQLIQELQTVPAFDPTPLKNELQEVQQKFTFLGVHLKAKLSDLESQLVIWRQMQQSKDELLNWLKDVKDGMKDALSNVSDAELARIKLSKYTNELPSYLNIKTGIDQKVAQLQKMNEKLPKSALDEFTKVINKELDAADDASKRLSAALGDLSANTKEIREGMKDVLDKLAKLREQSIKCDDTSGTDPEIFSRWETSRGIMDEVDSCEDQISNLNDRIQDIQKRYGTADTNLLFKELANVVKRYEGLSTQVGKTNATLYGILEKHYVELLQDEMKQVHTSKEKISWCNPEPGSDKFSLESKLDTIQDVIEHLDGKKGPKGSLAKSAEIMLKVVEEDKAKELKSTVDDLAAEKESLLAEGKDVEKKLLDLLELWKKYENETENLASWLKEAEEEFRQQAVRPVEMENFSEVSSKLKNMQSALNDKEVAVDEVDAIANSICQQSPETRINQLTEQLKKRFEGTKAALSNQVDKLESLYASQDAQSDAIKEFESWLANSKSKLQEFEKLCKTSNKPITKEKLLELDALLKDKDQGHNLLSNAITSGENMFAYIAPQDKEKIRQHIRDMRDNWENHIDYMSHVQKSVDAVALKWRSFEDNYGQLRKWLDATNAAIKEDDPKLFSLADKKKNLLSAKALQQDILSHGTILANLAEQAKGLDADAQNKMSATSKEYENLKKKIAQKLANLQNQSSDHESYSAAVDKVKDAVAGSEKQLELLMISPVEQGETQKRIEEVNTLLKDGKACEDMILHCEKLQEKVLPTTAPSEHAAIKQELDDISFSWQNHMKRASNYQDQLQALTGQLEDLQRELGLFEEWLSMKELVVKDHTMQRDVAGKQKYNAQLRELLRDVLSKKDKLDGLVEGSSKVDQDSDIATKVSHLSNRYNQLIKTIKEFQSRYDTFVKEHQTFDEHIEEFTTWMKAINQDLEKYGEVVGDLKALQDRKNSVEELEDVRANECTKYESILELGERLYSHTSPDGKEVIRKQLAELRAAWEKLSEDLQNTLSKLDSCLQQFADFTTLQEQLTKWLRDIEAAMQEHTELRASLEEKKGQLQSHRTVHQEITSHNSLVDAVCNKAQDLVSQTHDNSLAAYITSIKALFSNIGQKSKALMDKLQSCVEEHTKYVGELKSFAEFTSAQAELLSQCSDVSGDNKELEKKMAIAQELHKNKLVGDARLADLEALCMTVCKSTSPKGAVRLKKELQEIKDRWSTHVVLIDDIDINLEKAQGQWKQFNDDIKRHADWFKEYEGIFRNQALMESSDEKQEKLQNLQDKRKDVIDYEKTIDSFVNQSHMLIQNTGAEHLKPAITQASNRYQMLHVLSKEVVAKWQGLVEEHQNFDTKMNEIDAKLSDAKVKIQAASRESDPDRKNMTLQQVASFLQEVQPQINNVGILGERLFEDTNSSGRENIRKQIKDQRCQFDELVEQEKNLRKRQEQDDQIWQHYKECLNSANQWMDSLEPSLSDSPEQINWLSLQDARARLLKLKSELSEAEARKRLIEAVNEAGTGILQAGAADSDEVQNEVKAVGDRYTHLLEKLRENLAGMEEAVDSIQHYQDVQKQYMDWSKQMWNKLQIYTDYSGNKLTIESRMDKVAKVRGGLFEGKNIIDSLGKHVSSLDKGNLPTRAKDALDRDMENIRYTGIIHFNNVYLFLNFCIFADMILKSWKTRLLMSSKA